jgi:hypothetical protein
MPGNLAQTIALQREKVRPELPLMYQQDDTLWGEIKSRSDIEVVSSRPTRVPMELLAGGKFRVSNPDGGDLGRGSAVTTDNGTLVPVYFFQASEWTKATEINTDSSEKAIQDYVKLTTKRAMKQFNVNMEAAIQGDGSNTLDTVVSTTGTNQINVNNGNQFSDNLDIDVWAAAFASFRGTTTIQSVDANNKQLNLTAPFPAGTIATDLLLINGSPGAAGTGIFGVTAYQVNSNTGSVMGLSRAAYPGKLSTPRVNAASLPLTPSMARRLEAQIRIALGVNAVEEMDLRFQMNLDSLAAWENTGLNVTTVIQNQLKGDESEDMLKKSAPRTFMGRPIIVNIHAKPQRIDGLALKHWFRVENQPIDYYEVGGQTMFPTYGGSGGLQATTLFYLWTGVNIGQENVRAGVFCDNLPAVTGY